MKVSVAKVKPKKFGVEKDMMLEKIKGIILKVAEKGKRRFQRGFRLGYIGCD